MRLVTVTAPADTVPAVTVPVNVGLALSALVATAVAMLVNSVSISDPRTTFAGSPVVSVSFAVKLVVLT